MKDAGTAPLCHNDYNVWILGAGFSRDAGLPLMSDFLLVMRDSHEWLQDRRRFREARAIENVLQFRRDAAAASDRFRLNVENIEELFSLASASEGLGGTQLSADFTLAIAATLDYAASKEGFKGTVRLAPGARAPRHWIERDGTHEFPLYDLYLGVITRYFGPRIDTERDTIITFNYDLVIESALRRLDIPFDYGLDETAAFDDSWTAAPSRGLRVLKLHGSVNWASAVTVGKPNTIFPDYDSLRARSLHPLLVPPTWRKNFRGPLAHIWNSAVEELSKATRIIIVGFSLPETDLHFKYLLAAGLRENISLRNIYFVNPDNAYKQNATRVLRDELFDRGVARLLTETTRDLFARCHGAVNRPLPAEFSQIN